eukprot:scaffold86727_cov60-Phaeocystis_antarctica.AAC.7
MMCVIAFAAAWLPALPLPRKAAYLRLGGPVLMTDAEEGDASRTPLEPRPCPRLLPALASAAWSVGPVRAAATRHPDQPTPAPHRLDPHVSHLCQALTWTCWAAASVTKRRA